jgi:predicted DNA-binding protein (UPF0278 family)
MSIDYFLHSKNIYKNIEFHLKDISSLYEEFIELTEREEITFKYHKEDDINFLKKTKEEYEEKIKQIHFFKDYVNKRIVEICNHEFVNDLIDISPDKSKQIEYCTHCEYTKN